MLRPAVLDWLPRYRRADLSGDVGAGLTGAAMVIPQSMAYAQLADVPAVVGLYASVVPALAYAVFGRSRQLTIGPLTTISIIGALAIGHLAPEGSHEFIRLTATLAVMTGVVAVLLSFARFGALMRYASEPLIVGFLAGAAVIIASNQLDALFGYSLPAQAHLGQTLTEWASHLEDTNPTALVIGLVAIAALGATRHLPRIPTALACIVVATVVVGVAGLDVPVVGDVPGGIAGFSVPPFELHDVLRLVPTALVIALVGYVEAFGVARRLSEEHGEDIDPNGELFAIGSSNITAGFFGGMVVTGVPSRTAVMDKAGARTQLAGVVAVAIVAPLLLFGTGLLHDIPMSVLAAVVIVSISGFFRVGVLRRMWREQRFDAWIAWSVVVAIVLLGLELGILATIGIAIVDTVVRRRNGRD